MQITIKRYQNRKLYNTQAKRYITLHGIVELIKHHNEVLVIDNQSGEDITAVTLSQIIYDVGKNSTSYLPARLLTTLIQSGGQHFDILRKNIFTSLGLSDQVNEEIKSRINKLVEKEEMTEIEGSVLIEKLIKNESHIGIRWEIEQNITDYVKHYHIPTKKDLLAISYRIEDLSRRLSDLHNNNK